MNIYHATQLEFMGREIILMVLIHSKPVFHSKSMDAKLLADLPTRYIISSTLLKQLHPAPIYFCWKLVLQVLNTGDHLLAIQTKGHTRLASYTNGISVACSTK